MRLPRQTFCDDGCTSYANPDRRTLTWNGSTLHANAGYPSVWAAIKLFLVVTVISAVISGLVGEPVPPPYEFFTDGIIQIAVLLLILRRVQRRHPFPVEKRYPLCRLTAPQMLSILVISISLPFSMHIIDTAFMVVLPMPDWVADLTISAMNLDTGFSSRIGFVGLLFWGAFAAAVVEEVFDRGLVLSGFVNRYGYRRAIVFCSLFFALTHLNPWQAVTAFVIGLVLALVVLRTQSLVGAVWIHMVNNMIAFSIEYWVVSTDPSGVDALRGGAEPWPLYWNLLAAPVFLIGGYMFLKSTPDRRDEFRRA